MSQVLSGKSVTTTTSTRGTGRFVLGRLDRPAGYGWALAWMGAALVIVPLVFLAVMALFAWMSVWHLYQTVEWLGEGPYFAFHLPMALIGTVLLLMLIKPLFFRRKGDEDPVVELIEADQPRLFAFVYQLCDAAGAPRPSRIEVDTEPNAAVTMIDGWRGVRRRKLALRIGLPMVVSLPIDLLAGVLVHEFGHFNQKGGMGGTLLVRSFMSLLGRIVFERDRLDGWLLKLKFSRTLSGRLLYYVAVAMIEAARGVLWLMLMICQVLTSHMSRKMEHDADQLEAQLVGSEGFLKTADWMVLLGVASQAAHGALAEQWETGRLADNLPRLIAAKAAEWDEHRDEIITAVAGAPTRWWHSHPAYGERNAYVKKLALEPQFVCGESAETLFNNLDDLCRRASQTTYRARVGEKLNQTALVDTAPLIQSSAVQTAVNKSLSRFLHGAVGGLTPIFPASSAEQPREDWQAVVDELRAARCDLLNLGDGADRWAQQCVRSAADADVYQDQLGVIAMFPTTAKRRRAVKRIGKLLAKAEAGRNEADQKLRLFEESSQRRLTAAIQLGLAPAVTSRLNVEEQKISEWVAYWLGIARFWQDLLPHIQSLRRHATRVQIYLSAYNPQRPMKRVVATLLEETHAIRVGLSDVSKLAGHQPNPFEHGQGKTSIAAALFEDMPEPKDPIAAGRVAKAVADRYFTLAFRSLAQLTELAEKIERALDLDPLPAPGKVADPQLAADKAQRRRSERKYWFNFGSRAVAGVAMLAALAWLSFFPPDLPTMGFGRDEGAVAYRPASFATASTDHLALAKPAPDATRQIVAAPPEV
ncbi:MAG TPA: M48 family metallopeptidase, partial [Pirellulales bacterium]|nr:M48 family metallopeptidase [Pirellulales bacterium]